MVKTRKYTGPIQNSYTLLPTVWLDINHSFFSLLMPFPSFTLTQIKIYQTCNLPPRKKNLLSFFLAFQSFFLMDIKLIRPAPEEICKMTIMAHYTNIRNNYCDHIAPYFCIYIFFFLLFMPFYFLLKKQDVAMKNIIGHKTMNHIASSLIISSCFFEFRPTY